MQTIRPIFLSSIFKQSRLFSTTNNSLFKQKWREERGLPMNPTACGVLTDAPDYTFLDGRLTPYGSGQTKRIVHQRQIKNDIIHLTSEIDFAVDRHQKLIEKEENRKKAILNRKLKPKGINLLKTSKQK